MNFCLVGDKDYIENYAPVTARSYMYYNPKSEFHIICSEDFDESRFDSKIYKYIRQPLITDKNYFNKRPGFEHINNSALLKFEIFNVLPKIRICYVDVDTACLKSHEDIFESFNELAAVDNTWNFIYDPNNPELDNEMPHKKFRWNKDTVRWASGKIFVDLNKNLDLYNKYVEFIHSPENENQIGDMNIFNKIHPEYEKLPQNVDFTTYYLGWHRLYEDRKDELSLFIELLYSGKIYGYHYEGPIKPWNDKCINPFRDSWRRWIR